MRRGGFLLFVLLAAVIAIGFYQGWWTFNKEPFEKDKETATQKLKEDAEKLKDAAKKLKDDWNSKSSTTATK